MKIRPAAKEDMPRLDAMGWVFHSTSGLNCFGVGYNSSDFAKAMGRVSLSDNAVCLVADVDGTAVGMICGGVFSPLWHDGSRLAQEFFMWVDPDHRGKGFGKQLLAALEDWGREQGATAIIMVSLNPVLGETPADAMYTSRHYVAMETHYVRRL